MRLLLDTHAFIWFVEGDKALPHKSRELVGDTDNECYISSASLWEMTVKSSLGKLEMNISLDELTGILKELSIDVLTIDIKHLKTLSTLPFHHRDPFDRLIVAQAVSEKMVLISKDQQFSKYIVDLHWQ